MKTASNNGNPQVKKSAVKLLMMTALMAFIIISYTGCGDDTPVSKSDFCLDTSCEIRIYDDMDEAEAEALLDEAFDLIRSHEAVLSKTVEDSDVSKINDAAGQWAEVSEETVEVIRMAHEISSMSSGAFDITVGEITGMWDFKSEKPQVPPAADIEAALPHVGYEKIDVQGESVRLEDPDMRIDLGGIAKGYIADRACDFLGDRGVESAVVNLGGNVAVIGEKDGGEPWVIGIERPFADRKEMVGTIQARDATVVTSGIYERNFSLDGRIYHHILNPATGYPAETDLDAVTITAKRGNSGFCDAVSTACLVLGRDRAMELVAALQEKYGDKGIEAAFIDNNGDIVQTDGMDIDFSE